MGGADEMTMAKDPKPPPSDDKVVSGQKWVEAWAKKHIGKKVR